MLNLRTFVSGTPKSSAGVMVMPRWFTSANGAISVCMEGFWRASSAMGQAFFGGE